MPFQKLTKDILQIAVLVAVVYFSNQYLQTYLGQRAIDNLALENISFEDAKQLAQQTGKPIVAEFSAIWCGSCRKFHNQVLADPTVQQRLQQDYVFTRLEYESDDRPLFEQYGIRGFPTVLVLSPDGHVQKQLGFSFDPNHFLQQL